MVPAMLRARRHNQRGFAVLPEGCLPYLPLLRQEGKRGQPSTSVGLSGCPPEVFKSEGRGRHRGCAGSSSAVARSSGHRGPGAACHRAVAR